MFRLAEYDEGSPLYQYLSSVASQTIFNALDNMFVSPYDVEDLYENHFAGEPIGASHTDFFKGLSTYIKERSEVKATFLEEQISQDGRAGIELMWRKLNRMKEKMLDASRYYTFDLFEEYLFALVIDLHGGMLPEPEEEKEILSRVGTVCAELVEKFGEEKEGATFLANCVCRIEKMGLDESEIFFWDDDYDLIFEAGFVPGIRRLVSGDARIMGYGYDNVCSIFADCGIKAPLLLVGTESAFDTVGEAVGERMRKIKNPFDDPIFDKLTEGYDDIPDDEDLPFS